MLDSARLEQFKFHCREEPPSIPPYKGGKQAVDAIHANLNCSKLLADGLGFDLVFVLLPSKQMLAIHETDPEAAGRPLERLKECIVDAGFAADRVIDLLPVFARTNHERLFFPDDAHWTTDGHRFVADQLRELAAAVSTDS
ncbi:MAG: hypothetical protein V3T70_08195 [Phycisphaerae bacterium]